MVIMLCTWRIEYFVHEGSLLGGAAVGTGRDTESDYARGQAVAQGIVVESVEDALRCGTVAVVSSMRAVVVVGSMNTRPTVRAWLGKGGAWMSRFTNGLHRPRREEVGV